MSFNNASIIYTCNYLEIVYKILKDLNIETDNLQRILLTYPKNKDNKLFELFPNIFSAITFIVKTNFSIVEFITNIKDKKLILQINEIKIGDDYYTNMSLSNLKKLIIESENYEDKKYYDAFLKIAFYFPREFFYDIEKCKSNKILRPSWSEQNVYINKNDNVIFFDDLNTIDKLIIESREDDKFGTLASTMFNMTIHMYIPYYMISSVMNMSLKYTDLKIIHMSPLMVNDNIAYSTFEWFPDNVQQDIEDIYKIEKSLNSKLDNINYSKTAFITQNTMYKCIINCSISTLRELVKYSELEYKSTSPVLSFLYYCLFNFKGIMSCIKSKNLDDIVMKNLYPDSKPNI